MWSQGHSCTRTPDFPCNLSLEWSSGYPRNSFSENVLGTVRIVRRHGMAVTGLGLDLQSKPSKQALEASQERDSEGRCWKLELGLSSFGLKPKRCSNSHGASCPFSWDCCHCSNPGRGGGHLAVCLLRPNRSGALGLADPCVAGEGARAPLTVTSLSYLHLECDPLFFWITKGHLKCLASLAQWLPRMCEQNL